MDVVTSIKSIVDMVRGTSEFDPVVASMAALDIAKSVLTVFSSGDNGGGFFTPKNMPKQEDVIYNGLINMLPESERAEYIKKGGFHPNFTFPIDFVVKMLLMWVIESTLSFLAKEASQMIDRKREAAEAQANNESLKTSEDSLPQDS